MIRDIDHTKMRGNGAALVELVIGKKILKQWREYRIM